MKITDVITAMAQGLNQNKYCNRIKRYENLSDYARTTWINDDECRILLNDGINMIDITVKVRKPIQSSY